MEFFKEVQRPVSITDKLREAKARLEEDYEVSGSPEDLPEPVTRAKRTYKTLDSLERAMVVHAKRKHPHITHAALARDFGCSVHAIDRVMRKYRHIPPIKELLGGIAHEAVYDMKRASSIAAERGDPNPAEKILIHAGEIEPIVERERGAYGPQIVVGILPGMPQPQLQEPKGEAITVEALKDDEPGR